MKAFLMYKDRDFVLGSGRPANAADLTQDLELGTLFCAMADDDKFLFDAVESAVLAGLCEPEAILYRQQVLADCMKHSEVVKDIYAIAVEAIEREKKVWGWMSGKYPEGTLHRSVEVLQIFAVLLKKLRRVADLHRGNFHSEGFTRLFDTLTTELDDGYLQSVDEHLERLKFHNGIVMSAELGSGNQGINCVLRKPPIEELGWLKRLQSWLEQLTSRDGSEFVYEIHERDEAGFRALSELRNQGISHVAAALAQSTDHILSFFRMLRLELGFYIGCLNLRDCLIQKREPVCLPEPLPENQPMLTGQGIYDVCLTLSMHDRVVGNTVAGDHKALIMITGANRGGKSTLLRGIGLAQLMMQSGMFVPAESFRANVCRGIFTHFKREEDINIKSGKLDEELSRMSGILDKISPRSLVLFNESFASTNEREGSEIARQIVYALLETDMKTVYVTHMFDLAQSLYLANRDDSLFLRAERLADGQRTFRLVAGEPLSTSYGEDLYRRIFNLISDAVIAPHASG